MSSSIYFAVASTLASVDAESSLFTMMLNGQFRDASVAAAARAEPAGPGVAADYASLQTYADVLLVLGQYEEAEDAYRHAQKAIRGEHRTARAALSRNAGWQALFQNHLGTALKCFQRVSDDEDASAGQRLESLVGSVLVLFRLGRLDGVHALLTALHGQAARAQDARWVRVAYMLNRDIVDQYKLRSSAQLADHIYWHSAALETRSKGFDETLPAQPDDTPPIGVLSRHADYLNHLRTLAGGAESALTRIETHLRWSQGAGLAEYHRELRLEVTLAALAGRLTHVAETTLHVFGERAFQGNQHAHWYNELLYCQSKLRQQQGRLQDYAQMYARYALQSLRHVRADSAAVPAVAAERAQPAADDISARLPGKYRRAYRYLVEHLERPDLSVREVASHIGVTERALQAAFKANLGYTPSQLIRTRRMEHIRHDLLEDDAHTSSVLRIANRWGVQHRSTLLNGYRQLFNEAPSETLAR
ncbi:helix-turn-helix transcriptional regulator [Burkholderia metallica]|uniref:helix-turn-helix transcriptional regulator n=1 Tax=Burkholderia metallica TaxID=488729 RepID=UPI00157A3D29|nr:helix-turn-helix transcriptional regulator [Burkholderia metallica]NTZ83812.1 helix-turn-helix transcriptional regulator [Burkholderia metallica]